MHTEDDKSVETEGIGFPQSTGEMMSSQASSNQCNRCGRVFNTEIETKIHMADCHNDDNTEVNCSECDFKAKTQGELKEHHDIKHKPRPASKKPNTYDRCYDCQLIVNGYMELMIHKKEVHPSTKKCRNLDDGMCRF